MDPAAAVGGLESEGVAEKSTSEDADADVVLGLLDRRVLLVCLRLASSDTDASTIRSSSNSTPGSSNKVESARTGTVAGATGAAGASREEAEAWGEAVCGNAGPLALPKLLDLASLYGPANPLLVSQLLSNAITLNPKGLTHALANTGSVVLSVLESLRCSELELFLGSIKLTRRNKAPCFLLVSTQANNHAPQATRHTTAPQLCMIDNKIEFFFMYRLQIGPDRFDTEHVWLEEQSCYP
jgi:hypothetical protein